MIVVHYRPVGADRTCCGRRRIHNARTTAGSPIVTARNNASMCGGSWRACKVCQRAYIFERSRIATTIRLSEGLL